MVYSASAILAEKNTGASFLSLCGDWGDSRSDGDGGGDAASTTVPQTSGQVHRCWPTVAPQVVLLADERNSSGHGTLILRFKHRDSELTRRLSRVFETGERDRELQDFASRASPDC
jgi:hypothetical protein